MRVLTTLIPALGVFLAVSESGEADVECFAADDIDGDPVDMAGCEYLHSAFTPRDSGNNTRSAIVSTETFQAQYRVLEAFSLFNVILGPSVPMSPCTE